jgi:hypothetical protein
MEQSQHMSTMPTETAIGALCPRRRRFFCYIRFSSKAQEDGDSERRQLEKGMKRAVMSRTGSREDARGAMSAPEWRDRHRRRFYTPSRPRSAVAHHQLPAQQLGIDLHSLEVHNKDQLESAFATENRANALMALPAPIFVVNEKRIADFAVKNHFPSIFHLPEFAHVGGLLAYGPDRSDLFRRAATYVDKILKGAKPGDLPIEQPTKFQLALNLKTAKAIGLTVPQ